MTFSKQTAITVGIASILASTATFAGSNAINETQDKTQIQYKLNEDWSAVAKAAWTQGKLESLYMINDHLSAYAINTEIKGTTAFLSGKVNSEAKKELATEIAMSIDDITHVENKLSVENDYKPKAKATHNSERDIKTIISDATITASVKMDLIASDVKGRNINVDTARGIVILSGKVDSKTKKDLALQIAENAKNVQSVKDKLTINDS